MKKIFAIIVGAVLLASIAIYAGAITPRQAAESLKKLLMGAGYNCNVGVADIDENGVRDYAVEYVSGKEKEPNVLLLVALTEGVGSLESKIEWESDKVFLAKGETLYYFTTVKECARCAKLLFVKDKTTEKQAIACVKSIWFERKEQVE